MTANAIGRRLRFAFLTTAFVRSLRVAEQFLLVPIFFASWGAQKYGDWLAVSSVAATAAVVNFGIGHASYSDIVSLHGEGREESASRSFVTSCIAISFILLAGTFLLGVYASTCSSTCLISDVGLDGDARIALVALGCATMVGFFLEPLGGVIGATKGQGVINAINGIVKVVEMAVVAVALLAGSRPMTVALLMLISALLNVAISFAIAIKSAPWIVMRLSEFDFHTLARTWRPSLGYFVLFVAAAIVYVQVPRLLVFHYFGAVALASFSVLVTYSRLPRVVALMVSQPTQVEIGRALVSGGATKAGQMVGFISTGSILISSVLLVVELGMAPYVVPIWTHGNVPVLWSMLGVLALVMIVGSYFDAGMVVAAASNRVIRVAILYSIGLGIGLTIMFVTIKAVGPTAAAVCLLFADVAGAIAVVSVIQAVVPEARYFMGLREFAQVSVGHLNALIRWKS